MSRSSTTFRATITALGLAALALAGCQPADPPVVDEAEPLAPRAPLPREKIVWHDGAQHDLIVKFADDQRARVDASGQLVMIDPARAVTAADLVRRHGLALEPLIRLPERDRRALEQRAEQRSSMRSADLGGFYVARHHLDPDALVAAANALQTLDSVEYAFLQPVMVPPPGDIAPATSDYSGLQTYRGAQDGIAADYAASIGATGTGVQISDCEYAWDAAHEDLMDIGIEFEPGQTPNNFFPEHGTAVVGELAAADNGYGMTGLVVDAHIRVFSENTVESGSRRVAAIAAAAAASQPGDIILLEMQTFGATSEYVPAEWDPAVWTVTRTATDAGVIVVAAAGNGNANLDLPAFADYMARGDSGAIIVGAGVPGTRARVYHPGWWGSTHGSRVNVQGWGDEVPTLAYGDLATVGGDVHQSYTAEFGGTSGASPIVTAAAAAIQSRALAVLERPLTPAEMRALLIDTGKPQLDPDDGHIGPLPDLAAALDTIQPDQTGAPVVVSRVAYDVPGVDSVGEFLVLFNRTSSAIDLSGWTLADNTRLWPLPAGTSIAGGGTLAIARDGAGYQVLTGAAPDVTGLTLDLGNTGDRLTLRDGAGAEVDFVAWEDPAAGWPLAARTGEVVQRVDPAIDTGVAEDWEVAPL